MTLLQEKKKLEKELKTLEKPVSVVRKQLRDVEAKLYTIEKSKMIGKCFKFHNTYGGDDKKWWFYIKVLSYKYEEGLRTLEFQETSTGHFELNANSMRYTSDFDESYIPISEDEFNTEFIKHTGKKWVLE